MSRLEDVCGQHWAEEPAEAEQPDRRELRGSQHREGGEGVALGMKSFEDPWARVFAMKT